MSYVTFTVRDADGNVVRQGLCHEDTVEAQAVDEGETVEVDDG